MPKYSKYMKGVRLNEDNVAVYLEVATALADLKADLC